jgi:hypothetical protein
MITQELYGYLRVLRLILQHSRVPILLQCLDGWIASRPPSMYMQLKEWKNHGSFKGSCQNPASNPKNFTQTDQEKQMALD